MASFDFMDVSVRAYDFTFSRARYLLRVAVPVIFMKVLCLLCVFVFDAQDLILRQGLILFPALVVEAIFVAGLVRYLIYNEPIFVWGKTVTPPDVHDSAERHNLPIQYQGRLSRFQCVQAGMAVYLLIQIIMWAFYGTLTRIVEDPLTRQAMEDAPKETMPFLLESLIMVGMVVSVVWLFRLFLLYIPAAMGFSMRAFMKRIAGLQSSALFLLTWFACCFPLLMIFSIFIQVVLSVFQDGSAVYIVLDAVMRSVMEVFMICVQVSAMSYAVFSILRQKKDDESGAGSS